MRTRRLVALPAAAAMFTALALTGCGTEAAGAVTGEDEQTPIRVLTSFYPLQFVAQQVGGELVDVDNLTPPGADPHFLELSPARTRDIGDADVVVTLGGFIAAVDDAIEQRRPEIVVDAAEIVSLLPASVTGGHSHDGDHDHSHGHSHDDEGHGHSHDDEGHGHSHDDDHAEDGHSHSHSHDDSDEHAHEHEHEHEHEHDHAHDHADDEHGHDHSGSHSHDEAEESHDEHDDESDRDHGHSHGHDHAHSHNMGGYDPHFWLDPILLSQLAEPVAEALSTVDPENAELFQANAADLIERLQELDAQFAEALAPFAGSTMITNHTAFGYLAYRYGLHQIGIAGLDHNVEPSPARMREISEIARHYGVSTLFYETLVSPRVVQALAGDLGINAVVIDTLEGLTSAGIEAGDDYIGIMLRNLEALTEGLTTP